VSSSGSLGGGDPPSTRRPSSSTNAGEQENSTSTPSQICAPSSNERSKRAGRNPLRHRTQADWWRNLVSCSRTWRSSQRAKLWLTFRHRSVMPAIVAWWSSEREFESRQLGMSTNASTNSSLASGPRFSNAVRLARRLPEDVGADSCPSEVREPWHNARSGRSRSRQERDVWIHQDSSQFRTNVNRNTRRCQSPTSGT